MNYTYKDKTFTQEQVAEAASMSGLSFDDYVKKYGISMSEEDTAIERVFGKNVVTDFFGDIYRAGAQGLAQGASVEETFDVFAGRNVTDEEIQAYINADNKIRARGVSEEMQEYERIKDEAGGGVFGFLKAMYETRGQIIPQVIVSSAAALARTAVDSEEAAALGVAGAAAGSFVPVVGTLGGAIAGISGSLETASTFSELLKEELGEKEFNKENIRAIIEDKETMSRIKGKALARGAVIGAVEGITAGLSRNLAKTMVTKGASAQRIARSVTGLEAAGGATGEALGQVAAGQDFDIAEVLLEGVAETKGVVNVADILAKKEYKVNGKKSSRKYVKDLLAAANNGTIKPEDFHKIEIEVTGDANLDNAIKKKQKDDYNFTQIDSQITEESDRKKLVDLRNQEEKAEAAVNKKGIFKVLNAEANLKNIQQQIQEIQDKYSGVDRRKKASRAIEATKQQARIDRQQILLKATKNFAEVGSEQLGFDPFQSFQNNADFVKAYVERVLSGEISNSVDKDGNITMTEEQIEARANELAEEANNADAVNVVRAADGSKAIMINEEAAMKYGALQAGSHEILHGVLKGTLKQMNKAERKVLISEFKNQIKQNLGQKVLDAINLRLIANYKKEIANDADFLETTDEWFTMLSDIIEDKNNNITYENSKGFFDGIKNKIARVFNKSTPYKKLSIATGEDAFNFMKEYSKNVKEGRLSEAMVAFAKGQEADIVEDESTFSKSASDEVQNIYVNKGINGALEIIEKFKPITSRIAEKRRNAPNFDKELLMSEIEIGERGILDLIRTYDPDSGVPLAAYINQNLPKRAIEASRRVLGEEFTADVTEARTVTAEETADVDVTPRPKRKKIVLSDRFGITKKVNEAIQKIVPSLNFENINFKSIKNKLPNITGDLFGIAPKKIENLANLTKKELQAAQMFINKNADLLIAMLPEGATPSGTATGVPNTLLKAFYTKTERARAAKTGSRAGLAIQQKNNIDKKTFLETFGIIDGKPDRTDRNTSARVLALANLTGKMITNQAIRAELAKRNADSKIINEIAEGKSESMFSKSSREFNIDMDIDQLLTIHAKKVKGTTFKLSNEKEIDKYIEYVKEDLLPLMPRGFWFGKKAGDLTTGSELLPSYRIMDVKGKDKDDTKKKQKELYKYYETEIKALNALPDNAFGKPIPGVDNFQRTNYKTLFENEVQDGNNTAKKPSKKAIEEYNEKAGKIHKALWQRIFKAVKDNPTKAATIGNYLKLVGNKNNHWHRYGAQISGYSKNPKGKTTFKIDKETGKEKTSFKLFEYEHAMPATASYLYLLNSALNGYSFKSSYNPTMDNFKLIALDAADNAKLGKAGFSRKMPQGWNTVDNFWWQRYFNTEVVKVDGIGINPENIVDIDGETFGKKFGINAEGNARGTKIGDDGSNFSKSINNQKQTLNYHKNKRGMSTFDFDETLIVGGKNFVTATSPNGEVVQISSAEWPIKGEEYANEGYTFDFKDFVNVRGGTEGPLLQKMRNQIKKFGPKNVFVLTARQQQADTAIHGWLKTQGINIPIENITGLGNSTGEAKALWMANKFSEGYNDMYFVDDALPNVKAVKHVLSQLDVKSNVQQTKFSKSNSLDGDFNKILEDLKGISADEKISAARAKRRGSGKGRFRLFIPPSHEDLLGLLYNFMGKGEAGNRHRDFFEENIVKPLNRAYREYNAAKQRIAGDYKNLNKQFPEIRKLLTKKTPDGDFFYSDAVRVYLWDKFGFNIPNLNEADKQALVELIKSDPELKAYADSIGKISRVEEGYVEPSENWDIGDIRTDLADATDKVGRKKYFAEFIENVETIFNKDNLNKIEAAYGSNLREALEDVLYRTINGTNRKTGSNRIVNRLLDYLNGSVGAVMFFNARSAVLQQLSFVNFLNFADNNIFAASRAFADQKQFWSDYLMIFNSDMLKQRRKGASFDLNTNELSQTVSKSKEPVRALIRLLLQKGFLPTQIADSNAIALGGASFYRNRVNSYLKQGFSKAEAEKKAFADFQEVAESTQQSARPDMLSQQQASPLGRLILAFQNVTSQYSRLTKKAALDLINRRKSPPYATQVQSDMSNLSRIVYYGAVQNLVFYGLQSALFAMMFGEDEEEDEKMEKFYNRKKDRVIQGTLDSILRGTGVGGALIATLKNTAIKYTQNKEKSQFIRSKDPAWMQLLTISPPLDIKIRKLKYAERDFVEEGDVMKQMDTFDIDNPVWSATTNLIEGATNVPVNRLYEKTMNIREASNEENLWWQRLFLWAGWSRWNFGIENEDIEEAKEQVKKTNKATKKKKRGGFKKSKF